MLRSPVADADDLETQQAATIFGLASRYFEAAADMMMKGAPYRDPEVQRMIHAGYERLAKVREGEIERASMGR